MLLKILLLITLWLRAIISGNRLRPATISNDEMLSYLVQDVHMATPTQPVTGANRLARSSDMLSWRRHDWGSPGSQGYLASDSVLDVTGQNVIQTFDFGYTPDGFGRFDTANGDGGQVIRIVDGWASVVMTQDGGAGIQWFIGGIKSQLGWLMFGNDVTDQWQSCVAWLNKGATSDARPWLYNPAFTRYKRAHLTVPFLQHGTPIGTQVLDVIVCEHYSGINIDLADAAECFYFARGLGWIRWERWQNSSVTAVDMSQVEQLASQRRMPEIPEMVNDHGASWHMTDGRCWTNFVLYPQGYSVDAFDWQAAATVK